MRRPTYGVILSALLIAGCLLSAGAGASARVNQPTPPVTSADFPEEAAGTAPVNGDGLIPNPQTPTGSAVAPPTSCTATFSAGATVDAATVNSWITTNENTIVTPTTVCLSGTFTSPLHVWSKTSSALLEVAPAPGDSAVFDLGAATAAQEDTNEYESDSGGVSIVDSRGVEIYGLTIENYHTDGTALTPAGILVEARSDTTTTKQSQRPHLSACYLNGDSCSDIYLIDNTVSDITNQADGVTNKKALCGNPEVDAYGIAVISAGTDATDELQHVVIEGNTVSGTRTGQSETVTVNGNITDFLVADNVIHDTDNIGTDAIGWETGANQANHGLVFDNTVYDIDTLSNMSYGKWNGTTCVGSQENSAVIYTDGASFIWIEDNMVWNTNQGINLDVETAHRSTSDLMVSGNVVHDDPGTSTSDPSTGTEPPGVSGSSDVAGHDPFAFYVDAFGTDATVSDVYAYDNTFENKSQFALDPSNGMPVVDLGGKWSDVMLWHNQMIGGGSTDRDNPLLEIDTLPSSDAVINCNDYEGLSDSSHTVNGNFALPSNDWLTLARWQAANGHGWDADSEVGSFDASCPAATS
jgi:hypothetical protein